LFPIVGGYKLLLWILIIIFSYWLSFLAIAYFKVQFLEFRDWAFKDLIIKGLGMGFQRLNIRV
jgi:hypothetical protein